MLSGAAQRKVEAARVLRAAVPIVVVALEVAAREAVGPEAAAARDSVREVVAPAAVEPGQQAHFQTDFSVAARAAVFVPAAAAAGSGAVRDAAVVRRETEGHPADTRSKPREARPTI